MKSKNSVFLSLVLAAVTLMVACEKNSIKLPGDTVTGAKVKFVNACSNCPALDLKIGSTQINGVRMTYPGTGTASATAPNQFPWSGYATLPAGEISMDFIRNDSAKSFLTGKFTAEEGKWYTVFVSDTVPKPAIYVVPDDIQHIADTISRIRLVNMLTGPNKPALELVRKKDNKVMATAEYGKSSAFFDQQGFSQDTFTLKVVGATTVYGTFLGTYSKAFTRTFYIRGANNKTTGTQVPRLDSYTNR